MDTWIHPSRDAGSRLALWLLAEEAQGCQGWQSAMDALGYRSGIMMLLRACRRGPAQGAVAQVAQQRGVAGAAHPLHALLRCHVHGAQPFPHAWVFGRAHTRCVKLVQDIYYIPRRVVVTVLHASPQTVRLQHVAHARWEALIAALARSWSWVLPHWCLPQCTAQHS